MPFGTRFGNFPGSQELSMQLYLYFLRLCICGIVYLYLYLIMMRMHFWWNSDIVSFPERNTNSLEHQMSPALARPCHWVKHSNTNTKIQNKEIKTCSDNTNTEIKKKEIETCVTMICKGMSAKKADSCSDLTFADDVVAWARKDYAFETTISIPVPSSFF